MFKFTDIDNAADVREGEEYNAQIKKESEEVSTKPSVKPGKLGSKYKTTSLVKDKQLKKLNNPGK